MNDFTKDKTVAEVAVRHPEAKPILERLGIDYCCGGGATLEAAAKSAGHAVSEVRAEIEKAVQDQRARGASARDWSAVSAGDLAQHILDTHHVYMKTQLPRLADLFKKVISAHGERHGETLRAAQQVFHELKAEIEAHLMKEEQILFPYILQLDAYRPGSGPPPASHCGTVQNPIRQMEHEHESAGSALARIRELTSDHTLPEDACPSFEALYEGLKGMEADLHEHIHLENNILFPRAIEIEREVGGGS